MKQSSDLLNQKEIEAEIKAIEQRHMPQALASSVLSSDSTDDSSYKAWQEKIQHLTTEAVKAKTRSEQDQLLLQIEKLMPENPRWHAEITEMQMKFENIAKERLKECDQLLQKARQRIQNGENAENVCNETAEKIEELDRGPKGISLGIRKTCFDKLKTLCR